MNDTVGPISEITEEAVRILEAAKANNVPLRLLGGLAIYLQSPRAKTHEQLKRSYKDLDFVTLSKHNTRTKALFTKLGYVGNKNFNALHGHQRLLFWDDSMGDRLIFLSIACKCAIQLIFAPA